MEVAIIRTGNGNSHAARMLMIRFDIEQLTGKEAIELVKQRNLKA